MNDNKHIICVSGGGTKAIGLSTVLERVLKEHGTPKAYVGTSSGAIIALPMLMGKYDEVRKTLRTAKKGDFFDRKLNIWAALNGVYRTFILGHKNVGMSSMLSLSKSISNIISESEYEAFRNREDRPEIYVGSVNVDNGDMRYVKLLDYEYTDALQWITASASIPIAAEPVYGKFVDGGLRHHIGSKFLINKYSDQVDKCISIYSRPQKVDGIIDENQFIFDKTLSILMIQLSKSDQAVEQLLCREYGIDLHQYFLPKTMNGVYDLDPKSLRKLEELAEQTQPVIHKFKS